MTEPGIFAGSWAAFAPYGGLHLAAVVVCAILIALPTLAGRHLGAGSAAEQAVRRALAATALILWLAYNLWWNWNSPDLRHGLPLHICDVNGVLAPLALFSERRALRATVYAWTAALTTQAFVQPALASGPATLVFWAFWSGHAVVVACALYDLAVRGFRPDLRDFAAVSLVGAAYLAVIVPVNHLLGANYGFIGNPPPNILIPPFVDALGPWPQRAILVVAIAACGFALVLMPWRFAVPAAGKTYSR